VVANGQVTIAGKEGRAGRYGAREIRRVRSEESVYYGLRYSSVKIIGGKHEKY
jgi:hypothetical protein